MISSYRTQPGQAWFGGAFECLLVEGNQTERGLVGAPLIVVEGAPVQVATDVDAVVNGALKTLEGARV